MRAINLFGRWSIKTKIAFVFLSVSIFSVLVVGLLSHYYYSKVVTKDFFNISKEAAYRLNYFLDYYFNQFGRSSGTLIESDTIQQWLKSTNQSNIGLQGVETELRRYVSMNFSEIQGMFLVRTDKFVASTGQSFAFVGDYSNEPWYSMPLSSERRVLPTHLAQYKSNQGIPVISIVIPVFDINSVHLIGNLVMDISVNQIDRAFSRSRLGNTGLFFIVTDDGRIVYHPNQNWDGRLLSQTELSRFQVPGDQKATIQTVQGSDYLVAGVKSSVTGWNIISMVPFDEMSQALRAASRSMYIIVCLIFVFILFLVPYLTGKLLRRILVLKELMKRVADGDLSVRTVPVPGQDEFHQLNYSFNMMVARLKELFESNMRLQLKEFQSELKQKEAIIKALQNQINPHLLYNSLGIIKSIAFLKQVPMIEKMAGNLADIYRYTARFSEMETTLSDEIVHLQKYLELIHIRFPKHFQSQLYVNDKFASCRVVKFILQPTLENAVKYAIEPMKGKGVIIVNAYDIKDDLIVEIADNGPGIAADKLESIRKELDKVSKAQFPTDSPSESLGLINVHTRLVLKYGDGYGVRLDSFPGRGTVVSLRMPRQY